MQNTQTHIQMNSLKFNLNISKYIYTYTACN